MVANGQYLSNVKLLEGLHRKLHSLEDGNDSWVTCNVLFIAA